jgi:hypothetical protein
MEQFQVWYRLIGLWSLFLGQFSFQLCSSREDSSCCVFSKRQFVRVGPSQSGAVSILPTVCQIGMAFFDLHLTIIFGPR